MSAGDVPDRPEVPYPFPPQPPFAPPPQRTEPVGVPLVDVGDPDPRRWLAERRRVLVSGALDAEAVNDLCARLMALDGAGADPVEVVITSDGGPVADIGAPLDVIALMRAPVATTVVGAARGTAGVLAATGTGTRTMAPHATVSLRCDRPEAVQGSATDIGRRADEIAATRNRLAEALASATGQSTEAMATELDHGATHDATAAADLGLVDTTAGSTPGP